MPISLLLLGRGVVTDQLPGGHVRVSMMEACKCSGCRFPLQFFELVQRETWGITPDTRQVKIRRISIGTLGGEKAKPSHLAGGKLKYR